MTTDKEPQALVHIMMDPGSPHDNAPKPRLAETALLGGPRAAGRHLRCRLAAGSGPAFTDEMADLLRRRLRLAILTILIGFVVHFLPLLLRPADTWHPYHSGLIVGGCEIGVMALVSVLLWSHRPLSMQRLRLLELMIFGMIAAFFAVAQIAIYHDSAMLQALAPGHERRVFQLVSMAAGLRWFVLIVLYGAFIPNTWQRCTTVVATLAVIPVVLNVAAGLLDRSTGLGVLTNLPELILMMGAAAGIAVFGSHRMHALHRKAHEAERIGQYRLIKVLGFGGMGTVYLAEHVLLRRPCAVKLIRADQAGDPKALLRFEREVQATATLTHFNTIEVYDYGHTDDRTFYYVMEYLPGMNLEDMVERFGPLPPERAVHLLRQVCQALREAHSIGLLHRDLKPSNIIACERGRVYDVAKLLDFGLAKSFGPASGVVTLTAEGATPGSPAFMSPEQARGRDLDIRSDIYSLGATAYFLLTGRLCFEGLSAVEVLHGHAYEPFVPSPEFRESVSADLQQVIERCLKKDPDLRYQDAASLDRALAACQGIGEWTAEKAQAWWEQHHQDSSALPTEPKMEEAKQFTELRQG